MFLVQFVLRVFGRILPYFLKKFRHLYQLNFLWFPGQIPDDLWQEHVLYLHQWLIYAPRENGCVLLWSCFAQRDFLRCQESQKLLKWLTLHIWEVHLSAYSVQISLPQTHLMLFLLLHTLQWVLHQLRPHRNIFAYSLPEYLQRFITESQILWLWSQ